jgi:hypothetical protein
MSRVFDLVFCPTRECETFSRLFFSGSQPKAFLLHFLFKKLVLPFSLNLQPAGRQHKNIFVALHHALFKKLTLTNYKYNLK